jgi:hypothetical protein
MTVKQLAPNGSEGCGRFTGNMTVKQRNNSFEIGFLLGVLVGEGHFGGDGRQPHVTLRMHTDHEALFRWIDSTFPGGRLYGPYDHGGRRYFQWMARGPYLRENLLPILDRHLSPQLDAKSYRRFVEMKERYGLSDLPSEEGATPPEADDADTTEA